MSVENSPKCGWDLDVSNKINPILCKMFYNNKHIIYVCSGTQIIQFYGQFKNFYDIKMIFIVFQIFYV